MVDMTTHILIVNDTDENRLSLRDWASLVANVRGVIESTERVELRFFGCPPSWDVRRNVCAVFECRETLDAMNIRSAVIELKSRFGAEMLWLAAEEKRLVPDGGK